MTSKQRIINYGIVLVLIAIVAAIRAIYPTVMYHQWAATVESNTLSQPAYKTNTNLGTWKGDLPRGRKVSVVDHIENAAASAKWGEESIGGYYIKTGKIELLRGETLRPRIIAHEFGHAFVYDLLVKTYDGDGAKALQTFGVITTFTHTGDVNTLPECLRTVAAEYKEVPTSLYDGDGYLSSNLSEYLAESFAHFVEPSEQTAMKRLIPETAEFFVTAEQVKF